MLNQNTMELCKIDSEISAKVLKIDSNLQMFVVRPSARDAG